MLPHIKSLFVTKELYFRFSSYHVQLSVGHVDVIVCVPVWAGFLFSQGIWTVSLLKSYLCQVYTG